MRQFQMLPSREISFGDRWTLLFQLCRNILILWDSRGGKKRKKLIVLHKSEHFIVVDKEYDFLINSNDPKVTSSLHLSLCAEFPHLANPSLCHSFYFVHRLDYVTSGIIVIGLNKNASSAAANAFETRSACKFYLALLRGHVSEELMEINAPIGADRSEVYASNRMTVFTNNPEVCIGHRSAVTRLLVLERGFYEGYPATKVLLKPVTGRRHQLRVHCAFLGHTIVGDFTYSCRKDVSPHRTFLHALRLTLPNTVECLDISTADPFKDDSSWLCVEHMNSIDDNTYEKLKSFPNQRKKYILNVN